MIIRICNVCGAQIDNPYTATLFVELPPDEHGHPQPASRIDLCEDCDEATAQFLEGLMKEYGTYRKPETEVVADGGSGSDA